MKQTKKKKRENPVQFLFWPFFMWVRSFWFSFSKLKNQKRSHPLLYNKFEFLSFIKIFFDLAMKRVRSKNVFKKSEKVQVFQFE
jgi:hypothetical protein